MVERLRIPYYYQRSIEDPDSAHVTRNWMEIENAVNGIVVPGPAPVPGASGLFGLWAPGRYYWSPISDLSIAVAFVQDTLYAAPFPVGSNVTFTSIAAIVTANGAAGCVLRLGIYNSDSTGLPSSLVLDAGTVVATGLGAGNNLQTIVISQALTPGMYYLVIAEQIAAGANVRGLGVLDEGYTVVNLGLSTAEITAGHLTYHSYWQVAGVAGALPAAFPANPTLRTLSGTTCPTPVVSP